MERLMVKEAAVRAGVSSALVYEWCDERRLAHYRVGGVGSAGRSSSSRRTWTYSWPR